MPEWMETTETANKEKAHKTTKWTVKNFWNLNFGEKVLD